MAASAAPVTANPTTTPAPAVDTAPPAPTCTAAPAAMAPAATTFTTPPRATRTNCPAVASSAATPSARSPAAACAIARFPAGVRFPEIFTNLRAVTAPVASPVTSLPGAYEYGLVMVVDTIKLQSFGWFGGGGRPP